MKRELVTVDFSKERKLKQDLARYARRERLYLGQVVRRACRELMARVKGDSTPARV